MGPTSVGLDLHIPSAGKSTAVILGLGHLNTPARSAAFLPFIGNLAQLFGRKRVTMASVLFFAVGSAICGTAPSMTVLIVGRGRCSIALNLIFVLRRV